MNDSEGHVALDPGTTKRDLRASELAKALKKGPKTIRKYIEKGLPHDTDSKGVRYFSLSECLSWIYANVDNTSDQGDSSVAAVRMQQEKIKLELLKAKLAREGATNFVLITKRSRYGLTKIFPQVFTIVVGSGGDVDTPPPSAPVNLRAMADVGTRTITVGGTYYWTADGQFAADKWAIYAKVGSDPVPGVDAPALVTMTKGNLTREDLRFVTGAYNVGDQVHILVRTRRSSDGVESTNTTCLVVGVSAGFVASITDAQGFLGSLFRNP